MYVYMLAWAVVKYFQFSNDVVLIKMRSYTTTLLKNKAMLNLKIICDWILENHSKSHFINPRNANYKYSIQCISGTNLAASTQISGISVNQLLNG